MMAKFSIQDRLELAHFDLLAFFFLGFFFGCVMCEYCVCGKLGPHCKRASYAEAGKVTVQSKMLRLAITKLGCSLVHGPQRIYIKKKGRPFHLEPRFSNPLLFPFYYYFYLHSKLFYSMQIQSNCIMTTTTSLLSPPLTPTSDNQSIAEDVPWAVDHKPSSKPTLPIDHYTTASYPPELNARKGRNKSLIRYQQAMVMPQTPRPKKEFIHLNHLISVKTSPSLSAHSRKSSKPRRSLQQDERSDQKVFQLRVYDTDPSKLLQCSSRTIQPPMIKSDSADEGSNSEEEQVIAQMKRRRALSDANESMSKKCKTDAAMAFDRVHVEESDHEFFDPEWIPSYQVFDQRPPVRVVWKGKENHLACFNLCNMGGRGYDGPHTLQFPLFAKPWILVIWGRRFKLYTFACVCVFSPSISVPP